MIEEISLDGGHPCLDFANTVSARYPERGTEYLNNLEDFGSWLRRVDFLTEEELRPAERELPDAGEEFLEQVIAIREAIYAVFRNLAERNDVSAEALAAFNICLRQAYQQVQLEKSETGLRRGFRSSPPTLPLSSSPYIPLWRLLLLAEELLLQTELWPRIRACPSCGWLFIDTSKGGRRRWCNMQVCGSQVKAKRWYHKNKKD
ncbi:MAG: ABATE domain-containing protein [Lewinellaceae bacterium]|nr:ABATE domain-containing protein [Lewinellaceae bacterium]